MAYSTRPTFWQDAAIGAAGLWLVVSPWILGFSVPAATLAAAVMGLVLIAAALGARLDRAPARWRWAALAAGALVAASPWILEFAGERMAAGHAVVVGLAVALLAVSALARGRVSDPLSGEALTP